MTTYGLTYTGGLYGLVPYGFAVADGDPGFYLPVALQEVEPGLYLPSIIPVHTPSLRDVLYGSRVTEFRYELLTHDPVSGVDSLLGFLDGVEPGGSLRWVSGARVKKSGGLTIHDLTVAAAGMLRVADVNLVTVRIRPVMLIDGLPEFPLGVYVVTASPETWSATGRTYQVELHDKCTVLDQDAVDATFTANTTDPVLSIIRDVIVSAGELITVDASDTRTLSAEMVWPAGTSKLSIVNDLLAAVNYNSLWMDGAGQFQATPYVLPADRPTLFTVLNDETGNAIVRELTDGAESVYSPEWTRDRDVYDVPNRVVTVGQGSGDDEAPVGKWENLDPESPFSYPSRGRWVVKTLDGVEVPDFSDEVDPVAAAVAFLDEKARQSLILSSSPTEAVKLSCLPLPFELMDAVVFESTPAGIDARHTVTEIGLRLVFDALMDLELEQVVDL